MGLLWGVGIKTMDWFVYGMGIRHGTAWAQCQEGEDWTGAGKRNGESRDAIQWRDRTGPWATAGAAPSEVIAPVEGRPSRCTGARLSTPRCAAAPPAAPRRSGTTRGAAGPPPR